MGSLLYSEWKEHMLPPLHLLSLQDAANADVPTGVLPRKGNGRPPGADRLNAILKAQHDLQKKVNRYREGRLSHELNYANDGPLHKQLTKEQEAKLGSERNHLECPNPDCSNPDVQVEPDGRAVCQHCGAEVAKFASDTNDENSSRNVLDYAEEERQARAETHEAGNAPVRDSLTSARANLPGSGTQPAPAPASTDAACSPRPLVQVDRRTIDGPPVPHVPLSADPLAGRLQPPPKAPAQKEEGAQASTRTTATSATRADQMQGLQAEEVHVSHKRGPVRARALSPVSVSHREGGNPTRGLRLREAWAVHPALALHRARVH